MVKKRILIVAGVLLGAAAFAARSCAADPLPALPALAAPLPPATPPVGMAIYALPTGVTHRSAASAYRGGSFGDTRDFAMTAALVKHPSGDLLIDTGFGRTIDTQFKTMPAAFRAITSYSRYRSAADQLDSAHYDRKSLRAILLTHAHWDHTSGLPDFPDTPVLVTPEEREFIRTGGSSTSVARSAPAVRYEEVSFEGGSYLGFPASHDIYGDGAVVVVPAPGHTPGSVIIFVTLTDGKRFAFVGDLVWQMEGITEREERPWFWRVVVDQDSRAVRENIRHVASIAARYPEIGIIPAHDARAFSPLPLWQ